MSHSKKIQFFLAACAATLNTAAIAEGPISTNLDDYNLALYGELGADVYLADDGAAYNIGIASSRSIIGVRGEHQTSSVKVLFQLEQFLSLEEDDELLTNRSNYIGAQWSSMEVLVGQQELPFRQVYDPVNKFSGTIADPLAVHGLVYSNIVVDNVVQYRWFGMEGLDVIGFLSTDQNNSNIGEVGQADDNSNSAFGAAGTYSFGNFYTGVAYQHQDAVRFLEGGATHIDSFQFTGEYRTESFTAGGSIIMSNDYNSFNFVGSFNLSSDTELAATLTMLNGDGDEASGIQFGLGAFRSMSDSVELYSVFVMNSSDDGVPLAAGFDRSDVIQPASSADDVVGISAGGRIKF